MPPRYRYEEIATDLEKRIEAGEFPPGSRLPSRRQLIEQYEVTEPVIDRAMLILRVKGITETLSGVGVYVREDDGGE
ncbi:winged helix-turn-helix domain-containing protein [Paractinoplanes atraurantiacus]|uniref:Regulatory protein, gntR family n=1 Tax=Paractinoplanes atraurantiacus TaxID=1036182 RepID=A0A285JCZ9_9ACTN|nr:GntR family transcriptional regulator [Actinoplanes atraurantiacus]SNY58160.1 regulatory protein, gntR family [Actinoplanes atraurantiacus]